jgi:hypothetical protein
MTTAEIETAATDAPAGVLSARMQTLAQGYLDARKRAGYALLDAGRFLAEARAEAKHGDWYVFLKATNTSQDAADRLMAIYEQSRHDRVFADAVRTNFLNLSAAYELTTAPPEVRDRLLSGDTPPSRQQIRETKSARQPPRRRGVCPPPPIR